MGILKYFEMKLFFVFFTFAYANFLEKKDSSQFLGQRSKCGDQCNKDKNKCHRNCESDITDLAWCDCVCNLNKSRCYCKTCGFEDRCPEYEERQKEYNKNLCH